MKVNIVTIIKIKQPLFNRFNGKYEIRFAVLTKNDNIKFNCLLWEQKDRNNTKK
jgi:hypothetical protein